MHDAVDPPKRAAAASNARATSSGLETSIDTLPIDSPKPADRNVSVALASASAPRAQIVTCAPASKHARATTSPMPMLPPVTTIDLPARSARRSFPARTTRACVVVGRRIDPPKALGHTVPIDARAAREQLRQNVAAEIRRPIRGNRVEYARFGNQIARVHPMAKNLILARLFEEARHPVARVEPDDPARSDVVAIKTARVTSASRSRCIATSLPRSIVDTLSP